MPSAAERSSIVSTFRKRVNMTPAEITAWLKRPESKQCGYWHEGVGESVGRFSGGEIVRLLTEGFKTPKDYWWANKVNGYIGRHTKQRPDKPAAELRDTKWTWSLKNWGHDPLKRS